MTKNKTKNLFNENQMQQFYSLKAKHQQQQRKNNKLENIIASATRKLQENYKLRAVNV